MSAATLLRGNRNFRLILMASATSNLGDGIAMVALPWLATLLTRDPLLIAAVAMAGRLPWLLFALPAGVWIDQGDRRQLMLRADIARIGLTLCIVGLIFSTVPMAEKGMVLWPILALALIAFLMGCAEVIRDNAAQTILPSLVQADQLEHANGQIWSAEQVMGEFIGPPLAGLLIALGVAVPFGVNGFVFALSALLIWMIALPPHARPARQPFWPAFSEGMRWMRGSGVILQLAIMLGVINAVFTGTMTILVLFAQENLGLSPTGYGLLLTCGAAGGVLGGLFAPALAKRLGMRRSLLVTICLFIGINLVFGLFASVPLAAGAMFVEAFGAMLWNVVTVSYRQRVIPAELLGRVNAAYRFFGWGAMPFGAIAAGAIVSLAEVPLGREFALHLPYLVGAAISMCLLVYAALRLHFPLQA